MRKISRAAAYASYPGFPSFRYDAATDTDDISFPEYVRSVILSAHKTASGTVQFQAMAGAIAGLMSALHAEDLLFMGGSATPWRYQQNAYEPVADALSYLAAQRIGRAFNGGIMVDAPSLPVFLPHLMWIIAGNAALPEIYFTDRAQQVLGTLCQYGNLHLYILDTACLERVDAWIAGSDLQDISAVGCSYSATDMPEGRGLITV